MRIPVDWLKDFVQTDASAEQIGETLTMLGIELDAMHDSDIGSVLHLKTTPNRGDCLSVLGIARELAAKDVQTFTPTQLMKQIASGLVFGDEQNAAVGAKVSIEDPGLCPRYAARIFENVPNGFSSEKIQKRLLAAGMRPINLIVDLTNYVMLELGQPLHAFDKHRLHESTIIVKRAQKGSEFTTLDGVKRTLNEHALMICDAQKPVAIAGVMGGLDSEVNPQTRSILLESAHFNPISVRRTRKALNLNTEASYRFERYVDPEGVVRALNRFAALLKQESGNDPVPGVIDQYPNRKVLRPIVVREQRWNTVLGTEVPKAAAAAVLNSLGCQVNELENALEAVPPSWRSDLNREDDFVEEIGRVWGYEKIPSQMPTGASMVGRLSEAVRNKSVVRSSLLRLGFTEILSHTLQPESKLDANCDRLSLRNPGSPDMSQLRNSLLPGLAHAAAKNRGRPLFLFEVGRVFFQNAELDSAAFLCAGPIYAEHWSYQRPPDAGFFFAKGVLKRIAELLGKHLEFGPAADARFHPARQAAFAERGVFGQLSDDVCASLDLPRGTVACEFAVNDFASLPSLDKKYRPLNPYPSIRRDLAFVISKSVPFAEIENAVREAAGGLLENVWLFDVYESPQLPENSHSLAVAMVFRHPEKTLTDEEANAQRDAVVQAITRLGAQIR